MIIGANVGLFGIDCGIRGNFYFGVITAEAWRSGGLREVVLSTERKFNAGIKTCALLLSARLTPNR